MSDRGFGVDPAYARSSDTTRTIVRWLAIVIGVFALLAVVVAVYDTYFDSRTDGPLGSSYVTTAQGVGAWHDVLVELGTSVERLRTPFATGMVSRDTTYVVVFPDEGSSDTVGELRMHVARGGRAVLVGAQEIESALGIELDRVQSEEGGTENVEAMFVSDVASIRTTGMLYASQPDAAGGDLRPTGERISMAGGEIAVVYRLGEGEIITLSDPWVFSNAFLKDADNAVLAVRISGQGPVVFDEFSHGFGTDEGLGGLTAGLVRFALVGLLAALVAMWSISSRIGPPEQATRALPPARGVFIDAVAQGVVGSGDVGAFEPLRMRALDTLDRVGSRYDVGGIDAQRRLAGAQFGLSSEEVIQVATRPGSRAEATAMAAIAATIERALERTAP